MELGCRAVSRSRRLRVVFAVMFATMVTGVAYFAMPASSVSIAGHQRVTLGWEMWVGNKADIDAWNHVASFVHKQYPWITVKLTYQLSWPDYWVKLPVQISSNTMPDIVANQSLRTTGFQSAFLPVSTSQLVSLGIPHFSLKHFNQGILNGMRNSNGQLVGLPYDFGPVLMFYNKSAFQKYNIPLPTNNWTWAQFDRAVAAFKQNSNGAMYGYAVAPFFDDYLDYLTDWGGTYLAPNGQLKLNTPENAKLLDQYVAPVKQGLAALPPANATTQAGWAQQQWQAGQAAMYIDGPWSLLGDIAAVKGGSNKFEIGIAPLPVGPTGKSMSLVAGSGFGISKNLFKNHRGVSRSELLADSIKAIELLTGPQAEQYLGTAGRALPARIAQQKYWFQTVAAQGVPDAKSVLDFQLKSSVPYRTTNKWNGTSNAFNSQIVGVMQGSIKSIDALDYTQNNQGAPASK